jgi:excisionase family DNA binding protein
MLAATALAYILIADPPGGPHLPGVLGEIQDEARSRRRSPGSRPPQSRPNINLSVPVPRPRLNRESFPAVMTLKEAARYLRTSETEVLRLIDEGKLAASRDNFTYKIARSQLDELR